MVGVFSASSADASSLDPKEIRNIVKEVQTTSIAHGVQVAEEFVPVEHPMEPPEHDQPVRCPPPEPCIIHDGRLWKERLQLNIKRREELPFMKATNMEGTKGRRNSVTSEHSILPSKSAPTDTMSKLMDA